MLLTSALLLLIATTSVAAHAATMEVTLTAPGELWNSKLLEIDTLHGFSNVESMSLRLEGRHGCQLFYCFNHTIQYRCQEAYLALRFGDDVVASPLVGAFYSFPAGAGTHPFDITLEFESTEDSPLVFLLDGKAQLEIANAAAEFTDGDGWVCSPTGPSVDIQRVTLMIEYGTLVQNDDTAWGAVKALYR